MATSSRCCLRDDDDDDNGDDDDEYIARREMAAAMVEAVLRGRFMILWLFFCYFKCLIWGRHLFPARRGAARGCREELLCCMRRNTGRMTMVNDRRNHDKSC